MRKLYLTQLFLCFILISISSCTKNNPAEETAPTLEVSKLEISFPSTESEESIKVETNQENFKVEASKDWINTKKSNEGILISVSENTQITKREGEVTITAASLKKSIKVTQTGSEINVGVLPETFLIEAQGGDFSFDITINTDEYELTSNADWLKLGNKENKKIDFSVEKNETPNLREGKISVVVNGETKKEVTVAQKGKKIYPLPYLTFGATALTIKEFEEKRKNELIREQDISGTGTQIAYKVEDDIFNELIYLVNLKGYAQSSLFVKGGSLESDAKDKFEKYLLEEGFEERTEKGYLTTMSLSKEDKKVFVNLSKQVKAEFMADARYNHYRFVYYPNQANDYATFSSFPFFEKGITKEKVEEYENNNKGTLNTSKSNMNYGESGAKRDKLFFDVEGDEVLGRTYWVYYEGQTKHGLTQITNYYADVNLAFYQGLDGDYYLTKEFLSLAKANSFDYQGVNKNGASWFKSEAKGVNMYVQWYKDENLGWTLRISIY